MSEVGMDTDRLSRQLYALRQQVAALAARPETPSGPPLERRAALLEEFQAALHELQVAERELRNRSWGAADVSSGGMTQDQRYRDLFEFAPEGYLVTDLDGAIQEANQAAAALLHIPAMCPVGQPLTAFAVDEERPAIRTELDRLRRIPRDQVRQWMTRLQPLQGPALDVVLRVTVMRELTGRPFGLRWHLRDVTETKRAAEKIRESEACLRLFTEQVPAVLWTTDTELRITSSLGAGLAALNERPGQYVGVSLYEVLQTDDPTYLPTAAHLQALGGQPASYEMVWRQRAYQVRIDPFRDQEGAIVGCIGLALDVTERQRAEKALRENEEVFRQLAENTREVIWVFDPQARRVVYVSTAYEEIWARSCRSLYEQSLSWMDSIAPEDRPRIEAAYERQVQGHETRKEYRIVRPDGSVRWVWDRAFPIRDEHGHVWRITGIAEDITERKRSEAKLQGFAQRLQALSRRLLEVQELERRHLARELHDEIGQALTGLKLTLEMRTRLQGDQLHASLAEAQTLVCDLTARVRDLSLRLRPTMLDDLGLRPTLLWHFERYTAQTQVRVVFEQSGLERRFPPEVETAAYRIVQEALTNVARHAGTGEVTVRLWLDQDLLCLQIEDPGVGFDLDAVPNAGASTGLSGMQERAELLGGHLTVESGRGVGTRVTAELPIREVAQGGPDGVDLVAGG
jgi:PAS domain S-box-containing protein